MSPGSVQPEPGQPESVELEPVQPEPDAAAAIFGARLGLARAYARELAGSGVERGLIGPREVLRLWDRHVLNCAAVVELIPPGSRVADIGSGAGLPGLVLAIARPDLVVTLVEPMQRRVAWLTEAVDVLGLAESVGVVRARGEELERSQFDVVTARAVAGLDKLVRWCLPLVRPGGELLALKGQSAAAELTSATDALRRLGARSWSIETCGVGVLQTPATVVRIVAGEEQVRTTSGRRNATSRRTRFT